MVKAGKPGVVLDVCAKIPIEEMTAFLKKWNKERRLSLKTPEDVFRAGDENSDEPEESSAEELT